MLNLLYPKKYYNSIFEIDLAHLKEKGIRGIIVDLDNTLIAWGEEETSEELHHWLEEVRGMDFRLCIASNARFVRSFALAKELQLPLVARAWKPSRRAFLRAMKILKTPPKETAVVGDQIFTDVLGGNRLGLYTILVTPVSRRELWTTRLLRRVEKLILRDIVR